MRLFCLLLAVGLFGAVAGALCAAHPAMANLNFAIPYGVAVDARGAIVISDGPGSQIVKLSAGGKVLARWSTLGMLGRFDGPGAVAVGPRDEVFMVDTATSAIVELGVTGKVIHRWGGYGQKRGQFSTPQGLITDERGDLYVADTGNNRIQEISPGGRVIRVWAGELVYTTLNFAPFSRPSAIAVDRLGSLYIADTGRNRIVKVSPRHTVAAVWGTGGKDALRLNAPEGIAVDPVGNVYVADTMNRRVVKLSAQGRVLAMWNRARGGIDYPQRLAVGQRDAIYAVGLMKRQVVSISVDSGRIARLRF